jgi:hypothetical protein
MSDSAKGHKLDLAILVRLVRILSGMAHKEWLGSCKSLMTKSSKNSKSGRAWSTNQGSGGMSTVIITVNAFHIPSWSS